MNDSQSVNSNIRYAYSSPPPGSRGFSDFMAWKQEETYAFLALQLVAIFFALLISIRDERDRSSTKR
jgi:hypothetical protein